MPDLKAPMTKETSGSTGTGRLMERNLHWPQSGGLASSTQSVNVLAYSHRVGVARALVANAVGRSKSRERGVGSPGSRSARVRQGNTRGLCRRQIACQGLAAAGRSGSPKAPEEVHRRQHRWPPAAHRRTGPFARAFRCYSGRGRRASFGRHSSARSSVSAYAASVLQRGVVPC